MIELSYLFRFFTRQATEGFPRLSGKPETMTSKSLKNRNFDENKKAL
jgi:hypothetical protein